VNVGRTGPAVLLALAAATATTACFSLLTETDGLEGTPTPDAGVDTAATDGAGDTAAETAVAAPRLDKKYTEVLGRFVGRPPSPPTSGMRGVDLGVTFPADGRLMTLFGDTQGGFKNSFVSVPLAYPSGDLPPVKWLPESFTPLDGAWGSAGARKVPVEGLSFGGTTYVFFATGWEPSREQYGRLALAHSSGALSTLTLDFEVPTEKFVHVSVVQDASGGPGERYAWVFGSPPNARSVFLAKAPLASLGDPKAWRYLANGSFSPSESDASPLIDPTCVGELSVRRHPKSGLWIMAHTCRAERGVVVRTALSAAGPWSAPIDVMDSTAVDGGYGRTTHKARGKAGPDDGLSDDLLHIDDDGRQYGPYLVPEWFDAPAANAATATPSGTFAIVYTMSTLNPYTVWLMRTVLGDPSVEAKPAPKGKAAPKASLVNGDFRDGLSGWAGTPIVPFQVIDVGGKKRMTTKNLLVGGASTGAIWQYFTVDTTTKSLRFSIFGGRGSVKLLRGTEVLRESWGSGSDDVLLPVVWNLEDYRGDKLQLLIDDSLAGADGYVGVADFTFEQEM
jgi:hypothetical protein